MFELMFWEFYNTWSIACILLSFLPNKLSSGIKKVKKKKFKEQKYKQLALTNKKMMATAIFLPATHLLARAVQGKLFVEVCGRAHVLDVFTGPLVGVLTRLEGAGAHRWQRGGHDRDAATNGILQMQKK